MQTLNIIIYNKELQKKFSFDIKDYQEVREKYKISEKMEQEKNT